ncbi:MAG: hypothetical protein MUE67_12510 [Anaerolineales bacterium]|nr:hypothetical protein [Anaerolineales bacterium]
MRYKVHRLEAGERTIQEQLEKFLNELHGEVVAILPYGRENWLKLISNPMVGYQF